MAAKLENAAKKLLGQEASSRATRSVVRQIAREKEALEREVKTQVETLPVWDTYKDTAAKLQVQVASQARLMGDNSRQILNLETRMMTEMRSADERLRHLEGNLELMVMAKIGEVTPSLLKSSEQARISLELQFAEVARDHSSMKSRLSELSSTREESQQDFAALKEGTHTRLEALEKITRNLRDSQDSVDKLTVNFDNFTDQQKQRENYTRRLEFIVKDMESRVWPWRTQMEQEGRNLSPPSRPAKCRDRSEDVVDDALDSTYPLSLLRLRSPEDGADEKLSASRDPFTAGVLGRNSPAVTSQTTITTCTLESLESIGGDVQTDATAGDPDSPQTPVPPATRAPAERFRGRSKLSGGSGRSTTPTGPSDNTPQPLTPRSVTPTGDARSTMPPAKAKRPKSAASSRSGHTS
jgi:hypothetical protein